VYIFTYINYISTSLHEDSTLNYQYSKLDKDKYLSMKIQINMYIYYIYIYIYTSKYSRRCTRTWLWMISYIKINFNLHRDEFLICIEINLYFHRECDIEWEYRLFYTALLQKRPVILRSLLIVSARGLAAAKNLRFCSLCLCVQGGEDA